LSDDTRAHLETRTCMADVHQRVQPLVQLIPQPEVEDSDWGDLLAEPLLDMLTGAGQ
jgi:hypothetical protein